MGGVETYLEQIIPALHNNGHQTFFWYELDAPATHEQISVPDKIAKCCVSASGYEQALAALREWGPDVIYAHGLLDPELEATTMKIAPAVFFAHSYYGACISGTKMFSQPIVTPCSRKFGWQCLLHYYPHRCGGLSPLTMLKDYRLQKKRLRLLQQYKAVVTNSQHMQEEFAKYGLTVNCVHYPVNGKPALGEKKPKSYWHLLFAGRMEQPKGTSILLEALPKVASALSCQINVTFAGDGTQRQELERKATAMQQRISNLNFTFTGWIGKEQLVSLLDDCDLLVVPSLWPEPFGLAGPEAGLRGVPATAFAVGGIPDWLIDGVNGCLAPGNPPTSEGLAEAIEKCLRDADFHSRLRHGAFEVAQRFKLENHLELLSKLFAETAKRS